MSQIMERTKFKYEDWVRVRFGAGEPWQRCWAVINPPDEKAFQKQKKAMKKQEKTTGVQSLPVLKGDISFYPSKKYKKATPIATITNAYSTYAVYPQSMALIDQSTLVKVEGTIKAHNPDTEREGFVFIMPEMHPGVSGFEILLRWLFPSYDVFALYGRPGRLLADVANIQSLMFGMPREKDYGYLEVSDITTLIVAEGEKITTEQVWRKKLKELTLKKMNSDRKGVRNSLPPQQRLSVVHFEDNRSSANSSPIIPYPPQHVPMNTPPVVPGASHQRSVSEAQGYLNYQSTRPGSFQQNPPSRGGWANESTPPSRHGAFNDQLPRQETEPPSDDEDSDLFQNPINQAARYLQPVGLPEDVPVTPSMSHPPSSKPAHPLPPVPQNAQYQARMSTNTLDVMMASRNNDNRERFSPQFGSGRDQLHDSSRASQESNMFDALPNSRNQRDGGVSSAPPPPNFPHSTPNQQSVSDSRSFPSPPPRHALPQPPPLPSLHSQITVQSSLGYRSPIDLPPGYEEQSSNVLLAGPLPTGDRKTEFEDYAHRLPSPPVPQHRYVDTSGNYNQHQPGLAAPEDSEDRRFSWQPESGSPEPAPRKRPNDITINRQNPMDSPLPSPPIPAKIPFKSNNGPTVPTIQTNVSRKATPREQSETATPHSSDSVGSLANHVISLEALERIRSKDFSQTGNGYMNTYPAPADEDTLDRREAAKLMRKLSDSGSEYDDDEVDDYATDSEAEADQKPPPRNDGPRTGVMKTVGQKKPEDVVIGDAHYKPGMGSSQSRDPKMNIPKVDFGKTVSHGRSLSGSRPLGPSPGPSPGPNTKAVRKESAHFMEGDHNIHSQHASPVDPHMRRFSQHGLDSVLAGHNRSPSSGGSDEKKRDPFFRHQSGDSGGSLDSDPDVQPPRRKSMLWQPGMVQQIGPRGPSSSETAEQLVRQQAVAASQESHARNRYVNHRRSSGNILRSTTPTTPNSALPRNSSSDAIARPASRGGNAAFLPHGLVSTPDLHSHLSAREQEFVARHTGQPLLQLEGGNARKQPPHQAGLLGAIEAREREKKEMKDGWGKGNSTVQQVLAQRQHMRTPSSSRQTPDSLGRQSGQQAQQGYFPQQQYQQPQQIPQHQQQPEYYNPQQQHHSGYQQNQYQYQQQQQQQLQMQQQQQQQQQLQHQLQMQQQQQQLQQQQQYPYGNQSGYGQFYGNNGGR